MPKNELINRFIDQHTQITSKDPTTNDMYKTKRNSSEMAFAWRKKSKIQDVLDVQKLCDTPMQTLGYIPIDYGHIKTPQLNYPVMVNKSQLHIYD